MRVRLGKNVPQSREYRYNHLIAKLQRACGRMVLATNLPQEETYSPDDILQSYKEQQACERGFHFLKDPLFFSSRVFLKLPRRVMTLSFLILLCLVVYSLGQRQLPFGRLRDHVRLKDSVLGLIPLNPPLQGEL